MSNSPERLSGSPTDLSASIAAQRQSRATRGQTPGSSEPGGLQGAQTGLGGEGTGPGADETPVIDPRRKTVLQPTRWDDRDLVSSGAVSDGEQSPAPGVGPDSEPGPARIPAQTQAAVEGLEGVPIGIRFPAAAQPVADRLTREAPSGESAVGEQKRGWRDRLFGRKPQVVSREGAETPVAAEPPAAAEIPADTATAAAPVTSTEPAAPATEPPPATAPVAGLPPEEIARIAAEVRAGMTKEELERFRRSVHGRQVPSVSEPPAATAPEPGPAEQPAAQEPSAAVEPPAEAATVRLSEITRLADEADERQRLRAEARQQITQEFEGHPAIPIDEQTTIDSLMETLVHDRGWTDNESSRGYANGAIIDFQNEKVTTITAETPEEQVLETALNERENASPLSELRSPFERWLRWASNVQIEDPQDREAILLEGFNRENAKRGMGPEDNFETMLGLRFAQLVYTPRQINQILDVLDLSQDQRDRVMESTYRNEAISIRTFSESEKPENKIPRDIWEADQGYRDFLERQKAYQEIRRMGIDLTAETTAGDLIRDELLGRGWQDNEATRNYVQGAIVHSNRMRIPSVSAAPAPEPVSDEASEASDSAAAAVVGADQSGSAVQTAEAAPAAAAAAPAESPSEPAQAAEGDTEAAAREAEAQAAERAEREQAEAIDRQIGEVSAIDRISQRGFSELDVESMLNQVIGLESSGPVDPRVREGLQSRVTIALDSSPYARRSVIRDEVLNQIVNAAEAGDNERVKLLITAVQDLGLEQADKIPGIDSDLLEGMLQSLAQE